MPEHAVRDERKRKRKLKPDIATKRISGEGGLADGADKPHLGHTHHGAKHTKREGAEGGQGRWELVRLVVLLGHVADAAAEDEVLGKGDRFVDGEPVALSNTLDIYIYL